jgi:hypothetical protein
MHNPLDLVAEAGSAARLTSARTGWARPAAGWPAYACAGGLLVYAVGKAYYASQNRLGVPGGSHVPAVAYQELGHVALRQSTLATAGLVGMLLALATVAPPDRWGWRWLPRWLLLVGLWGALVPMAAGAPYLVYTLVTDGWPALGGGLRSVLFLAFWLAMTWSYQVRSRRTR